MNTSIVFYDPSITGFSGTKTCLVIPARTRLHIIMCANNGLVHKWVPLSEAENMRPTGMSLKKGLRSFGGVARRKGSTKAARTWLAKARESSS